MRAILTYHSLDSSGSPISVDPARFGNQMRWLRSEGVRVVPLQELLLLPDTARAAALTFDDGIANLLSHGLPVLEEMGWTAAVFVVTGRVGTSNLWRGGSRPGVPTLPLLAWDDLAALQAKGWGIESHSRSHPYLPTLGDEELDEELAGAAEDLQDRLGRRPAWLAYPYGAVDQRVAARAGLVYQHGCTTESRPLQSSDAAARLPRVDATYLVGLACRLGWGPGIRAYLRGRRLLSASREAALR
jgi:peptidoglycan/xylan/chitin deacetylase (PgdA/CDA1 family)